MVELDAPWDLQVLYFTILPRLEISRETCNKIAIETKRTGKSVKIVFTVNIILFFPQHILQKYLQKKTEA